MGGARILLGTGGFFLFSALGVSADRINNVFIDLSTKSPEVQAFVTLGFVAFALGSLTWGVLGGK